jgi:hypothetical protein
MSFETGYQTALDDLPLSFLRAVHRAESAEVAENLVRAEVGDDDKAITIVRYLAASIDWQRIDAVQCLCDY